MKIAKALGLAVMIFLFGVTSDWNVCAFCKVQEREKSLYGFPVETFSEREYDEYGTFQMYEKKHGKHQHEFVTISSCSLVRLGCNRKVTNELSEWIREL